MTTIPLIITGLVGLVLGLIGGYLLHTVLYEAELVKLERAIANLERRTNKDHDHAHFP